MLMETNELIRLLNDPNYKFPTWWTRYEYQLAALFLYNSPKTIISTIFHKQVIKNLKIINDKIESTLEGLIITNIEFINSFPIIPSTGLYLSIIEINKFKNCKIIGKFIFRNNSKDYINCTFEESDEFEFSGTYTNCNFINISTEHDSLFFYIDDDDCDQFSLKNCTFENVKIFTRTQKIANKFKNKEGVEVIFTPLYELIEELVKKIQNKFPTSKISTKKKSSSRYYLFIDNIKLVIDSASGIGSFGSDYYCNYNSVAHFLDNLTLKE